jgi:hypothetical protein
MFSRIIKAIKNQPISVQSELMYSHKYIEAHTHMTTNQFKVYNTIFAFWGLVMTIGGSSIAWVIDNERKHVDKRFEQVDKRFEQVDKRFENIEHELKEIKELISKQNTKWF